MSAKSYYGVGRKNAKSLTRNRSYRKLTKTARERKGIIQYLRLEELNSRQLSIKTGEERTNITRELNKMVREGIAYVTKRKNCDTTGRLTNYYGLKNPDQIQPSITDTGKPLNENLLFPVPPQSTYSR